MVATMPTLLSMQALWQHLLLNPYDFSAIEQAVFKTKQRMELQPDGGLTLFNYVLQKKIHPQHLQWQSQRWQLIKRFAAVKPLLQEHDGNGNTPLMIVCKLMLGERELDLLLESGSDVNIVNPITGLTALHSVVSRSIESKQSQVYLRKLLIAGAKIETFDHSLGWTPLMSAVFMRHETDVKILLEAGAKKQIKSKGVNDYPKEAALDIAERMKYDEMVTLLSAN
jgi:ankyrin repeat protein